MFEQDTDSRVKTDRDKISRRDTLKMATMAGTVPLTGVGVSGASTSDLVKIVTHKNVHGAQKTKLVPGIWKNHADKVSRVRRTVAQEHQTHPGVVEAAVVRSEREYGGKKGFAIEIRVKDDRARTSIPNKIHGVPVKTAGPVDYHLQCGYKCQTNIGTYNPTPGGVLFDHASCAGRYYLDHDGDGIYESVMLTAAHNVGNHCSTNVEGNVVTQHGNDFGEVVRANDVLDVAACQPNASYSVDTHIEDTCTNPEIAGFVTLDGLKDMQAEGHPIYNMGINSGLTSGEIVAVEVGNYSCSGYGYEGIKTKTDSVKGDSGGVVFDRDGGQAFIINIHSSGAGSDGWDCDGRKIRPNSYGTAAYHINDIFDGHWVYPG